MPIEEGPILRRRRQGTGFTIMEILIAIVVLVLGITGIVALFPTAIESGNQTVEDTYSSTICQSVVDAIAVGLRESRYSYATPNPPRTWHYFIFNHDGVIDAPPRNPERYDTAAGDPNGPPFDKDYCILLPQSPAGGNNKVAAMEPVFLYPIPDAAGSPKEQRDPNRLRSTNLTGNDDGSSIIDNFHTDFGRTTTDDVPELWYPRVYPLGVYRNLPDGSSLTLPPSTVGGDVRLDYRSEDFQIDAAAQQNIALDPYPSYGFCFALKRARVDTTGDGKIDGNDFFDSSLYELKVFIFKNFDVGEAAAMASGVTNGANHPVPRQNSPIRTFITLISI